MTTPIKRPPRFPKGKLSFKQNIILALVFIAYLLYNIDFDRLLENPADALVDSLLVTAIISFWGVLYYLTIYRYYFK